jgi:hypothetical protein
MVEFNTFIPEEITFAPVHPLGDNLDRLLANARIMPMSSPETWQLQGQEKIPGIVKRFIPLNGMMAWEYWWCVPGRMLLPEDVEVLRSDRLRVETILSKLVWLLGGHCFGEDVNWQAESKPVYDWQLVLEFARNSGLNPDIIDIDFLPTAIAQTNLSHPHDKLPPNGEINGNPPNYVAVEPGHWHIEFFQLQPIEGGFILQEPKPMSTCQIWTGKPFVKHLQTGEVTTRYNLGIATPFDLTSHPWSIENSFENSFEF